MVSPAGTPSGCWSQEEDRSLEEQVPQGQQTGRLWRGDGSLSPGLVSLTHCRLSLIFQAVSVSLYLWKVPWLPGNCPSIDSQHHTTVSYCELL